MAKKSLERLLQSVGSPVEMLRNAAVYASKYPITYPGVPAEFTNWRDEQESWREGCAFFDLSYHMTDLLIEGPDSLGLLSSLAVNSFTSFPVDRAKQLVACNPAGYVIGDGILFHLDDDLFEFVGRAAVVNWIEYHAADGAYDVELDRDDASSLFPEDRRRFYRYQLQGPSAEDLIEKLNGGPYEEIEFFRMGHVEIAGQRVRALRHGMSGQPGLEIFGPSSERERIKTAIIEAGAEFGLSHIGASAYPTDTLESGWIPSPLPAVYTGEDMRPYREWLPGDGPEGTGGSLGGSFVSGDVEDYYLTPFELGYGPFVKFDHEFVGRDALETMDGDSQRQKRTLVWNSEDVGEVYASLFRRELPYKYMRLPLANYAGASYDRVERDGGLVGLSLYTGYSYNERSMLSLAVLDRALDVGDEVGVVWGEPDGGSEKPTVESHRQIAIRAEVAPVPYASYARERYARGWRTKHTM
jgi:vanillate/3-O-methylgallate O-demethylase